MERREEGRKEGRKGVVHTLYVFTRENVGEAGRKKDNNNWEEEKIAA